MTILEIDWAEAIGSLMHVGSPYLFGWLRALYVQTGLIADGCVVVVARRNHSEDWIVYQGPVTQDDAATLVRALADLGIPGRPPRIERVPDSSDTWLTGSVRVVVGEQAQAFAVHTQCSGFQGPDADGLRAVFQRVLGLCGYGHQDTIFGGSGQSSVS